MCYPTGYRLTLIENTTEFNQPYLNKTSFDFDQFPTLKRAMRELIDLDSLERTGNSVVSEFDNCRNEVDNYLKKGNFLEYNNTKYSHFAYYHYFFELIAAWIA